MLSGTGQGNITIAFCMYFSVGAFLISNNSLQVLALKKFEDCQRLLCALFMLLLLVELQMFRLSDIWLLCTAGKTDTDVDDLCLLSLKTGDVIFNGSICSYTCRPLL